MYTLKQSLFPLGPLEALNHWKDQLIAQQHLEPHDTEECSGGSPVRVPKAPQQSIPRYPKSQQTHRCWGQTAIHKDSQTECRVCEGLVSYTILAFIEGQDKAIERKGIVQCTRRRDPEGEQLYLTTPQQRQQQRVSQSLVSSWQSNTINIMHVHQDKRRSIYVSCSITDITLY